MAIHRDHRSYLDRVAAQASNIFDLSKIPEWLEKNTQNPTDSDRKWNFNDHEYQIGILSDMADEVVAQKCSQVGASELWVRLALAMLAMSKSMTAIYVLPTSGFARKFSKARIDPVIDRSPYLRGLVYREVDSSELKQIGNNFLYIAGSYGQNSAISVPARALFQDEVDFCNQTTLTTFNSRLGHNKPGEFYKRSFSTPTVENYGINAMYRASSKAHYTVLCNGCNDWVAPNFMEDVEIPGYDGNLTMFEKEDLASPTISIEDSFIRCPSCKTPIKWSNVLDPKCRQWIHEEPDNPVHGYQIIPIDVPRINPIARTLRQITDYQRKKDWVNFKVGYPFSDSETSFLVDTIERYATARCEIKPGDDETDLILSNGTAFGLDVGKTSWFTVLARVEGEIRAIYFERIKQDGDNYLGKRVLHLIKVFGCVKGVVDAGPDISVSKFLVDKNPEGRVWACYYVRQQKNNLENFKLNEAEGIVTANRTGCFDALAKSLNCGTFKLTKTPELEIIKSHLSSLKRIDSVNDQGENLSSWVATGEDHYGHSLNYAFIAMTMILEGYGVSTMMPAMPTLRRQKMRDSSSRMQETEDPLGLYLPAAKWNASR